VGLYCGLFLNLNVCFALASKAQGLLYCQKSSCQIMKSLARSNWDQMEENRGEIIPPDFSGTSIPNARRGHSWAALFLALNGFLTE
jgi:hypothetical protein